MDFTNKNVLVTGASKGIGKATAFAFAQLGAQVGINYRSDDEAAQATLQQLPGRGHTTLPYDISAEGAPQALIDDFIDHYDRLDILINNAGQAILHKIDEVDFDTWQQTWDTIINTNLRAAADLCYWAAQHMKTQEDGRIVNVSSRGAFRGEPDMPAYGASKAGLNALSQSLAKALAPYNIYVGVVAPGFTETEMGSDTLTEKERRKVLEECPLQRMAQPEEVAHAITFLASEGAEYMTGAIIDVNGASYLRS